MINKKIKYAREYALKHHANQMYGNKPYSFHLDAVYSITVEFNLNEKYQIAAYLHDILEDTSVTKEMLVKDFGEDIAEIVFCVSGFGSNRKEKQNDIKIKMQLNPKSIDLKMCDRLANMLNSKIEKPKLYDLYCKEHNDLKDIFTMGNKELFSKIEEIIKDDNLKNIEMSQSKGLKVKLN